MDVENPKKLSEAIADLDDAVNRTLDYFVEYENTLNIETLVKHFLALRDNRDKLSGVFETLDGLYNTLSHESLPARFEEAEVDGITVDGRTVSVGGRMHASVNKEQAAKAFTWLRTHGLGSLIKEEVNSKSLSASLKELIESDAIVPTLEDGIKVYTQQYMSVRKK